MRRYFSEANRRITKVFKLGYGRHLWDFPVSTLLDPHSARVGFGPTTIFFLLNSNKVQFYC